MPSKVNGLQQKLQKVDISSRANGEQPIKDLTNLEAQSWVYETVLAQLGSDPSVNHEKIAKTIEAIENKRKEILKELEPRRPRGHRIFSNLQNNARELFTGQAEKDYEHLDKIVTNLILYTRRRQPSQVIISKIIKKLSTEIAANSKLISPHRLRLAYKLDILMGDISSRLVLGSPDSNIDGDYQTVIDELNSEISLLSSQFGELLKSRKDSRARERQYEQDNSIFVNDVRELHKTLADLSRERDELWKRNQKKNRYVRERDLESTRLSQENRQWNSAYTELQKQKAQQQRAQQQQSQQQSELTRKYNELHQLYQQKDQQQQQAQQQQSELAGKYNELYQLYQQKANEVAGLSNQISNLSRAGQIKSQQAARPQTDTSFPPLRFNQYPISTSKIKPVKTRSEQPQLTLEEWAEISNQSDYKYIEPYTRTGVPSVRGHYRRKPGTR